MSKSLANKILKDHGMTFVRMSTGNMFDDGKLYVNDSGKRVKGIYAANFGPITVTNVHEEKINDKLVALGNKLSAHFVKNSHTGTAGEFVVEETSRSRTVLSFFVQQFPAYTRSANLDSGYFNFYIVPVFEKIKK